MEDIQVYLHIIKAKDIKGVERNGKSDPYIKVMAQNADGKLHKLYKTETIKNTCKPKYYLELILRIPSNSESLVLQLKDWNALSKHKKLGVVVLPLAKMTRQPNVELHKIDGGGVLKLCTRMLGMIDPASALLAPPTPVEVLSKVRIHLEHNDYHPGEVVRGHVIFSDRDLMNDSEKVNVTFRASCVSNDVHYLEILEKFDMIQDGPRVWAFQFLLPKRVPIFTAYKWNAGNLEFSIYVAAKTPVHRDATIHFIPSFEGLEPKLSPRRPHPVAPNNLSVTWVDLPKIIYDHSFDALQFKINNSGTATAELKRLHVRLRYQRIVTEPDPKMPGRLISKEDMVTYCTKSRSDAIKLGPSETTEIRFVLFASGDRRPYEPSAPFESTGEVYERNYFLEVEFEPTSGDPIVIDRKPIFYNNSRITRQAPPNYELLIEPETFGITTIKDTKVLYPLLAPAASRKDGYTQYVSEPIPTEILSTMHRETITRTPTNFEELPPLPGSIFDVPFADAC